MWTKWSFNHVLHLRWGSPCNYNTYVCYIFFLPTLKDKNKRLALHIFLRSCTLAHRYLEVKNSCCLIHLMVYRIIDQLFSDPRRISTLAYFFHIFCLCSHLDKHRHCFSCNDHCSYRVGCRQLKDTEEKACGLHFVCLCNILVGNNSATIKCR